MKRVALQWLYAVKSSFHDDEENYKTYQFMGFDLVLSKSLDVKLIDSNTGPGTCLKPDWLWRNHSKMATEMALIVSTLSLAKRYGREFSWPTFETWERIYDDGDPDFIPIMREGECYQKAV